MNADVITACNIVAFKGVFRVECSRPNKDGRYRSLPAAYIKRDVVKNEPTTSLGFWGRDIEDSDDTIEGSKTRERDHACEDSPTDRPEQCSTEIKRDSVAKTDCCLVRIISQ
jgi:hypothetical protein